MGAVRRAGGGGQESKVLLALGQSGAQSSLHSADNIKIGAVQHGVLDGGGDFRLHAAIDHGITLQGDLVGGLLVGDVGQISVLDGVAQLGLFQTGDVGDAGDGAEGVDLVGLDQQLTRQVGGQELVAAAEISVGGRDSAEALIGLAGDTGDRVAVEVRLDLDLGVLLGHASGLVALVDQILELLLLQSIMLGLEQIITRLHLVTVGFLLVDLIHLHGGISGFLGEPVGIGEDRGLHSSHLLFDFEQSHFSYFLS